MQTEEIQNLTAQFLMPTYRRLPLALVRGQGVYVWDAAGKRYLDFVSGIAVNNCGHCHPRIVAAVCRQAQQLLHCSNLYLIEPQARLAERLATLSGLDKAFFCNSGAEANEAALKLARRWASLQGQGRYEIITALNSFHGRTLATVTATGQTKYQQGFAPLPPGFKYVPYNDLEALRAAVGPKTCAIMLEVVQGEGGVHPATPAYLEGARALCDQEGILLIFDEVQTGIGRTGAMFAFQNYGVKPDIMALAKALGGGVPIGAMLARAAVAEAFVPGTHASTFGGNPLATAAALATLEVLEEEGLVANARRMGAYFQERFTAWQARFPFIKEARGLGLMLGLELTLPAGPVVEAARERGLLLNAIGEHTLRLVPPLCLTEAEAEEGLGILEAVFTSGIGQ